MRATVALLPQLLPQLLSLRNGSAFTCSTPHTTSLRRRRRPLLLLEPASGGAEGSAFGWRQWEERESDEAEEVEKATASSTRVFSSSILSDVQGDEHVWEGGGSEQEDDSEEYALDVPRFSEITELLGEDISAASEYGLGSATLQDICNDYGFPLEFLMDVLCRWGIQPPIDPDSKLGDLVDSEQAYAVLELLNSVDSAAVYETYTFGTLQEIAEDLNVPLVEIFAICGRCRFNLPQGVETTLTQEEYRILLSELGR